MKNEIQRGDAGIMRKVSIVRTMGDMKNDIQRRDAGIMRTVSIVRTIGDVKMRGMT